MEAFEAYIAAFPEPVMDRMIELRELVLELVPTASEGFAYGMPAFKYQNKPLVYFAAFRGHIGIYALPSAHRSFEKELSSYKRGKGSVQFPHDQPLPVEIIKAMIRFNVERIAQGKS